MAPQALIQCVGSGCHSSRSLCWSTPLNEEIVEMSMSRIEELRTSPLTCEEAAELPRNFGVVTFLPLTVLAEYMHVGQGKPASFMFDCFNAVTASLLHLELRMAPYVSTDPTFLVGPRWWATPTGDPNAGKSPVMDFCVSVLDECREAHAAIFPQEDHTYCAGNIGKFQGKLRDTLGVCLLWGPELKPMLDPAFPVKGETDDGKFMNPTRLLESANGGAYEWGAASDLKALRAAKNKLRALRATGQDTSSCPLPQLLHFKKTNINLCLFQQFIFVSVTGG